jgi:hypothetical protein
MDWTFHIFLQFSESVTYLTLTPSALGTKNAGQHKSVISSTLLMMSSLTNFLTSSFASFS